jgi:serine protease Do
VHANPFIPALALALALPAGAQLQNLESHFRTTGDGVLAAFEPQREVIQHSAAVILDGRKEIACGVVISPDGDILTKASELRGVKDLAVTIDRKKYTGVKVLATDNTWDVAHLKVAASDLVPVVYAPTSAVPQGTWVVTTGVTSRVRRRILAGIVSARIREIPTAGGAALGVILKPGPNKDEVTLQIDEVQDNSGAKEAGLQPGDLITAIDGQPVKSRADMAKALKDHKSGDIIKLTYQRKEETLTADVRLMARTEMMADQMSRNDMMSGEFSERRSGFPRVLQHDILGAPSTVGGPLLDLDGRCLGMNIARANRAESFAIPVEDLKVIATRMLEQAKARPKTEPPAATEPAG